MLIIREMDNAFLDSAVFRSGHVNFFLIYIEVVLVVKYVLLINSL